jgi:hypothetical protein
MWNGVVDLQGNDRKRYMLESHMAKIKKDVKVFRP